MALATFLAKCPVWVGLKVTSLQLAGTDNALINQIALHQWQQFSVPDRWHSAAE